VFSQLSESQTVSYGVAAQVDATILDNCGNRVTSGAASVFFSNGDPPVVLVPAGDGTWQGTWQPQLGKNATLTLAAVSGAMTGTASRYVNIAPGVAQSPPLINSGGVINAANSVPYVDRIAPGEIVSIYGAQLASQTAQASFPLPTSLGSVQVEAGTPGAETLLPLLYVSPSQINAVVPPGIQLGSAAWKPPLPTADGQFRYQSWSCRPTREFSTGSSPLPRAS
jgi:hypothetical protein